MGVAREPSIYLGEYQPSIMMTNVLFCDSLEKMVCEQSRSSQSTSGPFKISLTEKRYSGDLNSELVRYSNGPK